MSTDPKIHIGICSSAQWHANTGMAGMRMMKYTRHNIGVTNIRGSHVPKNRNLCVAGAQRVGATHLMCIDSDMEWPARGVDRLVDAAVAGSLDIIGCNYVTRQPPHNSTVNLLRGREKVKGVCEVGRLGTGFLLIDMRVFEKLKRPYFRFPVVEEAEGVEPKEGGEDYYLCDTARAAGFRVWMDTDLSLELIHWAGDVGFQWCAEGFRMIAMDGTPYGAQEDDVDKTERIKRYG